MASWVPNSLYIPIWEMRVWHHARHITLWEGVWTKKLVSPGLPAE